MGLWVVWAGIVTIICRLTIGTGRLEEFSNGVLDGIGLRQAFFQTVSNHFLQAMKIEIRPQLG
jgi:hypothetical protein